MFYSLQMFKTTTVNTNIFYDENINYFPSAQLTKLQSKINKFS